MKTMRPRWLATMAAAIVVSGLTVSARQGGPPAGGRGGGAPAAPAAPAVFQVSNRPPVDQAAHDRGRALWAQHCIDCHGSQARGSDTGPNIIRTKTVNFDRTSATPGSVLTPFLKAGHPTQSGKASASFTDEEIVGMAHFLRQRVNDTMRSAAGFTVGDIVVGNSAAGEAFFKGDGKCTTCHNDTARNLAGIATRIPTPVDLQQRMMFPGGGGGRGGRGFGAPAGGAAIAVTITPASGPAIIGTLVEQTNLFITVRLADGSIQTVRRTPALKIVTTNPLQAHIDLLEVITDAQMHNLVAYLRTMK
jgi:cytochrome c oxidase cbb3-type subunit 3